LDPKSPEAQAFNQIDQKSNGGSIRPSPTPSGSDPFNKIFHFWNLFLTLTFEFQWCSTKFCIYF